MQSMTNAGEKDTPPILAIVVLGCVLAGLAYLKFPIQLKNGLRIMDYVSIYHSEVLLGTLAAVALNILWIYAALGSSFTLNRQGKRLEVLTGNRKASEPLHLKTLVFCLVSGVTSFCLLKFLSYPGKNMMLGLDLADEYSKLLSTILQANVSLAVFGTEFLVARLAIWKRIYLRFIGKKLDPIPAPANGIVLGTIEEEEELTKPKWVELSQRALNGNILITGSIGGGKTQGTILPYLDQILGNFNPRPSILAIDPKGTFIPEALKIIEKHGLSEHVLHMKLGGEVTFNPIFSQSPLKGAKFLDIAQMIRAAAVNFMGKSFDSPFWEVSAFNLIKNCLVLCAAKYPQSDFNLRTLYSEMVATSMKSEATLGQLQELSEDTEKFDEEERFNIVAAIKYLEEYGQFEDKVKTGILATSTAFINQFQEFQSSAIFCPTFDKATLKTMDEVVDQGKFLLFDISSPALAKSMGTFIKLHYEQSILDRLVKTERGKERSAVLIIDEYQDVVSTGSGAAIGDERFLAKGREAKAVSIMATQSLTSLKNSIGKDDAAKELIQNFRTVIAGNSTDLATIKNFQELVGQEERTRTSHSVSENSHHPSRNLILGGFESPDANISESVSTSEHLEYSVTGKEFSRLSTFEAFAMIYDGVRTSFHKLFLKPYFIKDKATPHSAILSHLTKASVVAFLMMATPSAFAFPNVCSVVKTSEFHSCLGFNVGACMCGYPPRPCAQISYYVPQTYVEVMPNAKDTFFGALPGAAAQLASLGKVNVPFGAEADDDTQTFHAHTLAVPLSQVPFSTLPCGGARTEKLCFDGMSEHLGSNWSTGAADLLQPSFLAWSLSPKACLVKGAVSSATGGASGTPSSEIPSCSIPMSVIPKYPPSDHEVCNGWGVFFPRSGHYNGGSQMAGALMIGSRMKSLSTEIFRTTPGASDEKWQAISPQSSSCFREGQNVGILETIKNVRETKRLVTGKLSGFLFVVWARVSCCKDLADVPVAIAAIEAMYAACQGVGGL